MLSNYCQELCMELSGDSLQAINKSDSFNNFCQFIHPINFLPALLSTPA